VTTRVAMIGLGRMGANMVRRIMQAEHVAVHQETLTAGEVELF